LIVLMEQEKVDSVKDITEYWGDVSIEEISDRVLKWKSTIKLNKEEISIKNKNQRQEPHVPNRIED